MARVRALSLVLVAAMAITAGCLGSRGQPDAGGAAPPAATVWPSFDASANAYHMAPVSAPAGDATAWAEVDRGAGDGEVPFTVTFHAQRGAVHLKTEPCSLDGADIGAVVWVDANTVVLGGRWLADLSGPGKLTSLPESAWSHQLSPDRTKLAFWGRTDPSDPNSATMGPQIYDLATGTVQVIKAFTPEDWGFEGEIGVLPQVTWLNATTLLFDGPRPGATSVFKHDLTTGRTELWREDGWQVSASGDGNYVAVAHAKANGDYATFIVDLRTGQESELSETRYPYPTKVIWRGAQFVAFNDKSVGVGRMEGGRPVFISEHDAAGTVIDVRLTADAASFVDAEVKDGQILSMKQVTEPLPTK